MMTRLPTIDEVHARFARGELTPEDLLRQCLTNIAIYEDRVHAWVMVEGDDALMIAKHANACLESNQAEFTRLPLQGIPIGVKDIVDVAGWPTKAGSKLRDTHRAERDATVVARLRSAGANLLGKTVTTEFACFDPPLTRNPWNLTHTPGGSSSGSAAAVAAGMCMAAIGSQTGGSILRPASFCGIVGFKPAFGSVPMEGVVPVSTTLDHLGPLTRCVADAKIMFAAMSGQVINEIKLPAIRFGLVREFFFEKSRPEAAELIERTIQSLATSLGSVRDINSPVPIAEMHRVHRMIMAVECATEHREALQAQRELFGPAVTSLIEEGLLVSDANYQSAKHQAREMQHAWERMFAEVDVLAMPTTSGPAPATLKTTGDPRWQSPWSLCGFPAITLPCGLSPEGMPLGLQLVSHANDTLLAIAAACDERLAFTHSPTFRSDSGLDA